MGELASLQISGDPLGNEGAAEHTSPFIFYCPSVLFSSVQALVTASCKFHRKKDEVKEEN